jgi:hypothetical protein
VLAGEISANAAAIEAGIPRGAAFYRTIEVWQGTYAARLMIN